MCAGFNAWYPSLDFGGTSFDFLMWDPAITLTVIAVLNVLILYFLYTRLKIFINMWREFHSIKLILEMSRDIYKRESCLMADIPPGHGGISETKQYRKTR